MTNKANIAHSSPFKNIVNQLRDDLNNAKKDFVLLYAYNGTGKTRISMEFKSLGKKRNKGKPDTLYFNAYTEDLFIWDNDLQGDSERVLNLNSNSRFFSGMEGLALDDGIKNYLNRYTDLEFEIDYINWKVSFRKGDADKIKVSRGEENIFIWCLFMALCELVIKNHTSYSWVKYLYIDDPISSLDDNNAIGVAVDLANLLKQINKTNIELRKDNKDGIKTIISSHHGLFFNVMCNELKKSNTVQYLLSYQKQENKYLLQCTSDTPFFYHIAMLKELKQAIKSKKLYTYHFNILRSIVEKTSSFFGYTSWSDCLKGFEDNDENTNLFLRALNLLSHGNYSLYEPKEMISDNKELFEKIFDFFVKSYPFKLD